MAKFTIVYFLGGFAHEHEPEEYKGITRYCPQCGGTSVERDIVDLGIRDVL